MFELKIQSIDGKSNFGWQFQASEQLIEFLEKQFAKGNCPYAPIVERDEEGNVISSKPNPDWTIEIIDRTAESVEAVAVTVELERARDGLKKTKELVALAKKANTTAEIRVVIVDLAQAILQISKTLGLADPKDK